MTGRARVVFGRGSLMFVRRLSVVALVSLAAVLGGSAVAVSAAWGALGDDFRVLPINGPGQPVVPAAPEASNYFWAGTCDTASAPAPDEPIPGGIGPRPTTAIGVLGNEPAPVTPAHCIDPGGAVFGGGATWAIPPQWRLAPYAQAGAHPDGTAAFAFEKQVDGSLDNIVVDLPPGFMGDPSAVARCSAQEFAKRPQQCPPASQVGVLDINLAAGGITGNAFGGSQNLHILPVYNIEPRQGNAAELGLVYLSSEGGVTARLVAKARTNDDFGVTTFIGQIPAALPVYSQTITIWGVPWAAANDLWRVGQGFRLGSSVCHGGANRGIPTSGLPADPACRNPYQPSWGAIRPFISNPTGGSFNAPNVGGCDGSSPRTRLMVDAFQRPGVFTAERDPDLTSRGWKAYDTFPPALQGCEKVPFSPDIGFSPTTGVADAATGLDVDLSVPQNRDPKTAGGAALQPPASGASQPEVDQYVSEATAYWKSDAGLASAHLKDTVVTLPPGVALNPSGATGLQACSDAQIGLRALASPPLFNNGDPFNSDGGADGAECPQGSIVGTARVDTPLLDTPLTGEVVLGEPKSTDPRSGQMLRLFIVVRNPDRGVVAKIYGSTIPDGTIGEGGSGQLTARFENNPRVPFDRLRIQFKGGERGVLRNPQQCGTPGWSSVFTPWSEDPGQTDQTVTDTGAFAIAARCELGFSPDLTAADMDDRTARRHGRFSFAFKRDDGEQWFGSLTAKLPQGLLASVRDVPLCTNAQAAAASCPLGSQIGIVDAKAGSGDPFTLEEPGRVYLTEAYKGGAYGLAVKIAPTAGPFRGPMELSTIVVRQAIHVDLRTAQVTAVSDPFPRIWHGVPLAVREVAVVVDRSNFMLNASGCSSRKIEATIASTTGTTVALPAHYRATDCARLAFKPRLSLALRGRRQATTGRHPALRAVVRQKGVGEAGISRARVALPKSLALDVDNAQALCEFEDGTKPDLENHCPKGSIVGRARAKSPLLNRDLVGNVYFVKNVRIDKQTGNTIRTLPMIIAALRGEIAINLRGTSNVTPGGKLINTFANVPDAPVNKFNLNIKGGKTGILAVTRTRQATINLCTTSRTTANTTFKAHNHKQHTPTIKIKTPCNNNNHNNNKRRNKR